MSSKCSYAIIVRRTVKPFATEHKKGYIDIFRISSLEQQPVRLRLGLQAASLLIEEYPLAEKYLKKVSDDEWILEADVSNYEGVGRFIIGLLHDIEILEPEGLKIFIRKKLQFGNKI